MDAALEKMPMTTEPASQRLCGKRILIVEDWLFVADEIQDWLEAEGSEVLGPVPTVAAALDTIRSNDIDAAVLDVNLGGEFVFDAAVELDRRGVPYVFTTGYSASQLPAEFASRPCLPKPIDCDRLCSLLHEQLRPA